MEKIANNYFDWLKNSMKTRFIGKNLAVSTPFLDSHNDGIDIYLIPNEDGTITITDDGYYASDIDLFNILDKPENREKLQLYLNAYNIKLENGELTTTFEPKRANIAIHFYILGIMHINELR